MVAIFGLVFSLWCIVVFLWLGQYLGRLKRIQERLGIVTAEDEESKILRLWRDAHYSEEEEEPGERKSLRSKLRGIAYDAGWESSVETVLMGVLGVALLAFVILLVLTGSWLVGLAGVILFVAGFSAYTRYRIDQRAGLFERQLVDALGIAARSLRAGHPLTGAFQLISQEVGDPLGSVFFRICQQQELGLDTRDSIRQVARSTGNPELKLFATAVSIQMQSGGNLADLMDSLAAVIRARMRLNRRVRVLTAQTRFSARILIALPIFLFVLLNIINPGYMEPLYKTPVGKFLLALVIAMMLLGWWLIRRMSILKY
jgi:tight adherence protein B